MPNITVKDALQNDVTIWSPETGRRPLASSSAVAFSTEDFTVLQGLLTALQGALTVQFDGPQAITGTLEAVIDGPSFPGYKPGDNVTVVDGSARILWTQTVVTGTGSAATVLSANPNRKGIVFLPAGAANDWVYNFYGTAAAGASPIYPPAGGPFVLLGRGCPTGALSLLGTASQKLVIWEGN